MSLDSPQMKINLTHDASIGESEGFQDCNLVNCETTPATFEEFHEREYAEM